MATKRRTSPSQVPAEVFATRRANLMLLIDQHGGLRAGGQTKLAMRLGHSTASRLSQLVSGVDEISERVARGMEAKLNLPRYWMDDATNTPATAPPALEEGALLMQAMQRVLEVLQAMHATLAPEKQVELTRLVYEEARRTGQVAREYVERLVKLAR